MQEVGDAYAWHHGIEPVGQRFGVGRRDRANGGYLEAVVAISHTLQSVALQALGKFLKPPVKFAAPLFEPFAGCGWQTESRSEEHTSELQSLMRISYAVFCLKKKTNIKISKKTQQNTNNNNQ